MASWVCGQVPHEATTLITPVACFVGAANHAQKPQPSRCGWDAEGLIANDERHKKRDEGSRCNHNDEARGKGW